MRAPVACLGFRNWHRAHLQRCLWSLWGGGWIAGIVVCDLGSDDAMMPEIRATVASVGGQLVSSEESEWSRSRALNLAAAHVREAPWYLFTDADMLFPLSWFQAMRRHLTESGQDRMFVTRARDLDEAATESLEEKPPHFISLPGSPSIQGGEEWLLAHSTAHPPVGQGGAMLVPGRWFRKVGGFDEAYKVWGAEDNDLVQRAHWDGLLVSWLLQESGEHAWVAHQWHRRDWPTPEQFEQVRRNRAYLAERMVEKGPIVRNRKEPVNAD